MPSLKAVAKYSVPFKEKNEPAQNSVVIDCWSWNNNFLFKILPFPQKEKFCPFCFPDKIIVAILVSLISAFAELKFSKKFGENVRQEKSMNRLFEYASA